MTLKEVDENKVVVDEVCKEVFRVLNALKHPDVSEQVMIVRNLFLNVLMIRSRRIPY